MVGTSLPGSPISAFFPEQGSVILETMGSGLEKLQNLTPVALFFRELGQERFMACLGSLYLFSFMRSSVLAAQAAASPFVPSVRLIDG